ncbi:MAG: hypothetical protein DMG70_15195 [Acidobacteria bacterium]|nr:MAG: hypothetical protein DMG70_15195 [Acidobacteriota bacterium]PYY09134.1 MAG: hypothetical protein DMG69_12060 [Acidobacteriota bacterium]
MWMEKLSDGVLRVLTPLGPRYIRLTFWQRLYLMWIFRHFDALPQQVLSGRQQNLIDSLCASHGFIVLRQGNEAPIIGTVERRPPILVDETPLRRKGTAGVTESAHTSLADQKG